MNLIYMLFQIYQWYFLRSNYLVNYPELQKPQCVAQTYNLKFHKFPIHGRTNISRLPKRCRFSFYRNVWNNLFEHHSQQ